MTDADWKAVMDKSTLNAKEWIKNNSEHLDKLNEWLNTEVNIGNTSYNEYYVGNIRELIYVLGMQHYAICECIEKKIRGEPLDVKNFIEGRRFRFTHGDKVTAQNLSNLCTAIYELDEDKVKSLHAMLCLENDKKQSLFDWTAWRILVEKARKEKGYSKHPDTSPSVNPWYKNPEGGGRKLSRRRKSNPKSKSKHKHKRRSYKKSSYRRQRH
jgi:hypothetical protein